MDYSKIAFLGCGNMGGALASAAAKKTNNIILTSRSGEKAEQLARELGVSCGSNVQAAQNCDVLFLGVKPQMMKDLMDEIAPVLSKREDSFVLVTMAAGLTIDKIRAMAGGNYPTIRIMPNTPASIGRGMILYCADGVEECGIHSFLDVMSEAGVFDMLPEHLIDAGSAVSGCGPAFVYAFIEAMADGGVACGLPRAKAQLYAAQTLAGAAELVMSSGQHPGALKDAVCSPGGSTIQGMRALEDSGFRGTVMEAVIAAYEKTVDLGK